MNRLYVMREVYQAWMENSRTLAGTGYDDASADPFFDPPEDQMLGKATIYLDSLEYCLSVEEPTPVIDYKGKEEGELLVKVIPHPTPEPPASEEDEEDFAEKVQEWKGKPLYITVKVLGARGLPSSKCFGAYVKYSFFVEDGVTTEASKTKSINPRFENTQTYKIVVTDEFIRYITTEAIEFEVWYQPAPDTAAAAPRAAAPASRAGGEGSDASGAAAEAARAEADAARQAAEAEAARMREEMEAMKRQLEEEKAAALAGAAAAAAARAEETGDEADKARAEAAKAKAEAEAAEQQRRRQEAELAAAQAKMAEMEAMNKKLAELEARNKALEEQKPKKSSACVLL
jgi:flagellar biosynthesis GTPase FlhF